MRLINHHLSKEILKPNFWLLGITVALIAIHINAVWKFDSDIDKISISAICWGVILLSISRKHQNLALKSNAVASFFGLVLIFLPLVRSMFVHVPNDILVEISPLITFLGLGMITSGFRGLKQYWQEAIVICTLVLPQVFVSTLVEKLINLNEIAAQFAYFLLWYGGFDVKLQGVNVMLPTGSVEVYAGCSGLIPMLMMFKLSVLFLVLFPPKMVGKILLPILAVLIAFIVNGVRIALMAILAAFSNLETFDYWHQGDGSQIFSLISILIFGLFCRFILLQDNPENSESARLKQL
jgi:cyanoexosortase A